MKRTAVFLLAGALSVCVSPAAFSGNLEGALPGALSASAIAPGQALQQHMDRQLNAFLAKPPAAGLVNLSGLSGLKEIPVLEKEAAQALLSLLLNPQVPALKSSDSAQQGLVKLYGEQTIARIQAAGGQLRQLAKKDPGLNASLKRMQEFVRPLDVETRPSETMTRLNEVFDGMGKASAAEVVDVPVPVAKNVPEAPSQHSPLTRLQPSSTARPPLDRDHPASAEEYRQESDRRREQIRGFQREAILESAPEEEWIGEIHAGNGIYYSLIGGKKIIQSVSGPRTLSTSPDGKLLALQPDVNGPTGKPLYIISTSNMEILARQDVPALNQMFWSPDSRYLLGKPYFSTNLLVFDPLSLKKAREIDLVAGLSPSLAHYIDVHDSFAQFHWNADGSRLAFHDEPGRGMVSIIDFKTGGIERRFPDLGAIRTNNPYYDWRSKMSIKAIRFHPLAPTRLAIFFTDGSSEFFDLKDASMPAKLSRGIVAWARRIAEALMKRLSRQGQPAHYRGAMEVGPWSPDGDYLPTMQYTGVGRETKNGTEHEYEVVIYDRQGRRAHAFLSSYFSGMMDLRDQEPGPTDDIIGNPIVRTQAPPIHHFDLYWTADNKLAIFLHGRAVTWDPKTGQVVRNHVPSAQPWHGPRNEHILIERESTVVRLHLSSALRQKGYASPVEFDLTALFPQSSVGGLEENTQVHVLGVHPDGFVLLEIIRPVLNIRMLTVPLVPGRQ